MRRIREISFAKLHGLSNDFLAVNARETPPALSEFAIAICQRHTGVGADGLLVISPPREKSHDARVRFFNADGGEAEMSGNGVRCAAAFLFFEGMRKREFHIETAAGTKTLRLKGGGGAEWVFRVSMGAPILAARKIPFKGTRSAGPILGFPLRTHRGVLPVTVTSMGNPHCSIFVADFGGIDWSRLGREIEMNPLFPRRTNVEFVKVISRREIEVRFWERGVGETMSSGTGSCAAAVAAILNRRTGRKVRVRTPAGKLEVEWPARGEVALTGPAALVARGTYSWRG
jgi:diaminopimelate epimerase